MNNKIQQFKKTALVNAMQLTIKSISDVYRFIHGEETVKLQSSSDMEAWERYEAIVLEEGMKIKSLEGVMTASVGDWVLKGSEGECWPVREDIFAKTYEVTAVPTPAADGGREAFIEKVIAYTFGTEGFRFKAMSDKVADFMRSHWPAAGVAEPGMRWVKASDRLPEVGKNVIVRTDDRCITTTGKVFENSEQWQAASDSNWYFDDTEWLDETPAPSAPSPVGVTREDAEKWAKKRFYPISDIPSELVTAAIAMFDYLQGKAITESAPIPDQNAITQASADYVSRNKLGVSTIGMRSGFEDGAKWAFSHFPGGSRLNQ